LVGAFGTETAREAVVLVVLADVVVVPSARDAPLELPHAATTIASMAMTADDATDVDRPRPVRFPLMSANVPAPRPILGARLR
jgi:hypothetical protein